MKTCELCGERNHDGPCYADLREQWKQKDVEHFLKRMDYEVVEDEDQVMKIAYRVVRM